MSRLVSIPREPHESVVLKPLVDFRDAIKRNNERLGEDWSKPPNIINTAW